MWGLARPLAVVVKEHTAKTLLEAVFEKGGLQFSIEGIELNSGRNSPYRLGIGPMMDAETTLLIGGAFADVIVAEGLECDMLGADAYQGIPIAVATSIALLRSYGISVEMVFVRKEMKRHAEGGRLIGPSPKGKKIVFVDNALSSGKAFELAFEAVYAEAQPELQVVGNVVMLDREERGLDDTRSAAQKILDVYGVRTHSVLKRRDVMARLEMPSTILHGVSEEDRQRLLVLMEHYHARHGA